MLCEGFAQGEDRIACFNMSVIIVLTRVWPPEYAKEFTKFGTDVKSGEKQDKMKKEMKNLLSNTT